MTDLCLRFESRQQMVDTLYDIIEPEDLSEIHVIPKYKNIDDIGTIYKPTGNTITDSEGNEYQEQLPIPGYHVNIRLMGNEPPTGLEQHIITPQTPYRVWA